MRKSNLLLLGAIMKRTVSTLTLISMLLITLLLVVFVPSLKAASEAPKLQWSRTYGTYEGYSVIQTTDGGYAVSGVNATYGLHGYNQFLPTLVKTDSSGEMQWKKTYGTEFGVSYAAKSIVQTADSGYALSGYGGWILKLDAEGNVQWNKTYGMSISQSFAIQARDGGFVLAGWMRNNLNRMDTFLVKTDQNGFALWNKTLTTGRQSDALVYALLETNDGGYALTGEWENGYFWLAITDSVGNLLVSQTYNVSNVVSYSVSFAKTVDGGYILAGGDGLGGEGNAWLVKTDSLGNAQWIRSYPDIYFVSVSQTVDGGYLAAKGNLLVKTDASGNVQWDTGSLLSDEGLYSVLVTKDGGYAVAGGLRYNIWLAKFASESNIPPNDSSAPFVTIWIVVAVIMVAVVGAGFLVYFTKRKRQGEMTNRVK
jgi:hypothetical protein